MKKITKGLCLLLAVAMCLIVVQPVSAKTKYTKTEKNLAYTLAAFQDNELLDPDSFKIRKISSVKYTLNKDNYEGYEAWGILDDYKTITWKVDYTAANAFGGIVRDTVYVTSTWAYCGEDDIDFEEYTDKTNYSKTARVNHLLRESKNLRQNTIKNFREVI